MNNHYNPAPTPPQKNANGLTIASFVLGITANTLLFITCLLFPYLSFLLAILGVVLGGVGRSHCPVKLNTAALVLNLVALVLSAFLTILFILFVLL